MSSPKAALNKRVKISSTGRPYVDVADLVKTRLDRIEKARREQGGQIVDRDSQGHIERPDNPPPANNHNGNR
jgi:hypothetical protein